MSKKLVLSLLVATVLAIAILAVPRPVAAQLNGGWVDEIIFSVIPQDQAVASVSSGDTDVYVFSLDDPLDKIAAQNDPNIIVKQAFSGTKSLGLNPVPHGAGVGGFNPFTIREIREAMQWAFDRDFVVSEFAGGFAIPMITAHFAVEPNFVRDAAFFAKQEAKYTFDFAKAKGIVDAEMAAAGASLVGGKWQMAGEPVEIIIVQRIEDYRFDIGAYAGTVMEDLGFTVVLDPSPFDEALDTVYFGDPTIGSWHMYTEGWGTTGFQQFNDADVNFYYGDEFGNIYDFYTPPASINVPCQAVDDGDYANLIERRDLIRACVEAGLEDPVRVFLQADSDVYIYNEGATGFTFDLFAGNQNFWGLKTVRKGGVTGGTLNVAQPIHTGSAWNQWGGFSDVYSEFQRKAFVDPGVVTHPHLGISTAYRADFEVTTVGPTGQMALPEDALYWNLSTNEYKAVGPNVTSASMIEYTFNWGEWHHGEPITMDDVKSTVAMIMRIADTDDGDLGLESPGAATWARGGITGFNVSFRGVKFVDDDTAVVWYDSWNPDEEIVAADADIWPEYPWELNAIMAASVLANETSFADEDAGLRNNVELDLAKGPTFPFFVGHLGNLSGANFIPSGLGGAGNITSAEATARWAALNTWWTDQGNFMVSNGPYFLDQYFTAPEGAVYKAKRDGYPLDINKWEALAEIRVPDVALGPAPQVKLSFPAIFTFTTTLAGQAYDLIAQATWLISDPATREVLFDGSAFRTGSGEWAVQLTGAQTATLEEGTFQFQSIVVGEEAALPIVSTQTFTALDLEKAILTDLTNTLDAAIADFGDDIDALTDAVDDANAVANAATTLANTLLIIAIVAVVVAAIGIVGLVVLMRRVPPGT